MVTPSLGSSPLARGLPAVLGDARDGAGIIPARAGFTYGSWTYSSLIGDHPRSRGVYLQAGSAKITGEGSSPLARGLRGRTKITNVGGGIIPARAGFTRTRSSAPCRRGDHPRSRGVYIRLRRGVFPDRGSSPLARGLHGARGRPRGPPGIIPARAGFTRRSGTTSTGTSDHPRSRGVYLDMTEIHEEIQGSSPLARGLPSARRRRPGPARIIPARAGFTTSSGTARWRTPDHPRSRGVYVPYAPVKPQRIGSSPLARGLPLRELGPLLEERIIPARAGFTC